MTHDLLNISRTLSGFCCGESRDPISDQAVLDAILHNMRAVIQTLKDQECLDQCDYCAAILQQKPFKRVLHFGGRHVCARCVSRFSVDETEDWQNWAIAIARHVAVLDFVKIPPDFRGTMEHDRRHWLCDNLVHDCLTLIKRGINHRQFSGWSVAAIHASAQKPI